MARSSVLPLVAACALGAGCAETDEPSWTWLDGEFLELSEPRVSAFELDAVVGGDGALWAAWVEAVDGRASFRLVVARLAADGTTQTVVVDEGATAGPEGEAGPGAVWCAAPTVAPSPRGVYVVWERLGDGEDALVFREVRRGAGAALDPRPVEAIPGADRGRQPSLVADGDGGCVLAFRRANGASFDLYTASRAAGATWGPAAPIAETDDDEWAVRLERDREGRVHAVWDAFDGESFDVRYARLEDGRWVDARDVASGAGFEAYPDLALAPDGTVWFAWEEGEQFGEVGALRAARRIGFGALREGAIRYGELEPAARRGNFPRIVATDAGVLLTTRVPLSDRLGSGGPAIQAQSIRCLRLDADGARGEVVDRSDGDAEPTAVPVVDGAGRCVLAFTSDNRVRRLRGKQTNWGTTIDAWFHVRVVGVEGPSGWPALSAEREGVPRSLGPTPAPDRTSAREAGWYFGDLHRHTHRSRCAMGQDGTTEDAIRYARGPGALDFVAVTDHFQHLNERTWLRARRDAARWNDPGRLVVFPAIERFLPDVAHFNQVFPGEPAPPLDRVGWGRVPTAAPETEELWIPHMMGVPGASYAWRDFDAERHRLFEVYQGARGSFEGPNEPLDAVHRERTTSRLSAGLAAGHHFGVIASSDHGASSDSFAVVRAEARTREAIWAGLRARRTLGAMGPHVVDVRLGELEPGARGQVASDARVRVRWDGEVAPAYAELLVDGRPRALRSCSGADPGSELVVVTSAAGFASRERPIRIGLEGGRVLDLRAAGRGVRGAGGVVAEDGTGADLHFRGAGPASVVVALAGGAAGLPGALSLERGLDRHELRLADLEVGESVAEELDLDTVRVWRLGSAGAPRRGELVFEDVELREGKAYAVRVAWTDGGLTWSSPMRVDGLIAGDD